MGDQNHRVKCFPNTMLLENTILTRLTSRLKLHQVLKDPRRYFQTIEQCENSLNFSRTGIKLEKRTEVQDWEIPQINI